MNKRAALGDILMDNIIFLILLVLFISVMTASVIQQRDGVVIWEQYYAAELVEIINFAEPGDEIIIDVHKATVIAKGNEVEFREIYEFDNVKKRVGVKLSRGRKTYYSYFNDVSIVEDTIELAVPINVLKFKVVKGESAGA